MPTKLIFVENEVVALRDLALARLEGNLHVVASVVLQVPIAVCIFSTSERTTYADREIS